MSDERRTGFKSWFLRIVTTLHLASVPELEARGTGSSRDEPEVRFSSLVKGTGPALDSDSAHRFTDKLDADSIRLALQRLPREYVAVTALSLADSLSHQEIATTLDTSVATMRSTLHRGRALLKQALWEMVVGRGLD
jgi:RNA polymerase sigma-70 factor (ECF subfamily)